MRKSVLKLSFLALLLALLLLPLTVSAEEEPVILNDMVQGDGHIEVRFLNTVNNDKTDATLLLCYGKERLQVVVVDGGLSNSRCYLELTRLRSSLMEQNGLGDQQKDKRYKLSVTLVVTHCHKDHIAELYGNVVPSKLLNIEALYLPPATALTTDGTYNNNKNGDVGHRTSLLSAMRIYAPYAPIYVLDYGETMQFALACGQATIYAPLQDWGVGDALQYILDVYYAGQTNAKKRDDVPVAVVNANCQWLHVTLGDYSILFPGDIMKKRDERQDEPMDLMVAAYGEAVRSDIVKYPHHGIKRNQAAALVSYQLLKKDGIAVLTTGGARDAAGARLKALNTPFVTTEDGSYTFIITENGIEYRQE